MSASRYGLPELLGVHDLLLRLKTALAGRYAVDAEIGSGGTATAYLADDLKHHRQVAIKVLRPDLDAALGATRFLPEIEIAARLAHPPILPLHGSGEAGGLLRDPARARCLLRQRLENGGRIPLAEALRIVRDVGTALDYAHRQGFVHRGQLQSASGGAQNETGAREDGAVSTMYRSPRWRSAAARIQSCADSGDPNRWPNDRYRCRSSRKQHLSLLHANA